MRGMFFILLCFDKLRDRWLILKKLCSKEFKALAERTGKLIQHSALNISVFDDIPNMMRQIL